MPTLTIHTSKPGVFECYLRFDKHGFPTRGARKAEFEFEHPIGDWTQECAVTMKAPINMRGNAPTHIRVRYTPTQEMRENRRWVPRDYVWTVSRAANSQEVARAAQEARCSSRYLLTRFYEICRKYPSMELATWFRAAHIAMGNSADDNRAVTELRVIEELFDQAIAFLARRSITV